MASPTTRSIRIQKRLQTKYDTILHFYFARKIRSYIRKKPKSHELTLFNDYLYLDGDDEFLKRPYKTHEIPDRIKLLAAYFKRNRVLPTETPYILEEGARKLLDKRSKRRLKATKKVKEMDQAEPFIGTGSFIRSISSSQLQASESAQQLGPEVSYQTRLYDIYTNSFSSQASRNSMVAPNSVIVPSLITLPIQPESAEANKLKDEQVSHLICNFNDKDIDWIINQYNSLSLKFKENKREQVQHKQPELSLKLNLSKLQTNDRTRKDRTTYQKFYQEVKKKQEEKKPGKVYYVRGAQRNHQYTSRSPENEYIVTPRDHDSRQRIHTLGNGQSDRIFIKPNLSPELVKSSDRFPLYIPTDKRQSEKIPPSNRNIEKQYYEPPVLTDRTGERENHYKRILDRMRESKKMEMQARANSVSNNDKEEKSRRLQKLKEKAAELLSHSKGRIFQSPPHYAYK